MRKQTHAKINAALLAWNHAPMHVRAMAGNYVLPLLEALTAINAELAQLQQKIEKDDHGSQA